VALRAARESFDGPTHDRGDRRRVHHRRFAVAAGVTLDLTVSDISAIADYHADVQFAGARIRRLAGYQSNRVELAAPSRTRPAT
jgi:hypothetical protein